MSSAFRIEQWEQIPAAISRMHAAGADHRVPVLQALYRGEIAHLELERSGSVGTFKHWERAIQLPGLLLIGDDDHTAADGPDGWPIAQRVLRWARFVLIHGGPGDASHYRHTVHLTRSYARLVMIECSSANVLAWQKAATKWSVGAEGLVMCPPPGVVHPIRTPKAELH